MYAPHAQMTLKLNIFFTSQSLFVPFRKCKLKYKLLMGFTLRREAQDSSSQTLNFRQAIHPHTVSNPVWAMGVVGSPFYPHIYATRAAMGEGVGKGYATNKPLPIRETRTPLFTPSRTLMLPYPRAVCNLNEARLHATTVGRGEVSMGCLPHASALYTVYPYACMRERCGKGLAFAFEQSDSYPSLSSSKNGSSNKKVNKKFIKFFKHWYFDIAPVYQDNKQVRENNHSSFLVMPPYSLQIPQGKKAAPLVTLSRVMVASAKDNAAVDNYNTLKSAMASPKVKEPVRSIGFKSAIGKNSASKWGGFSSLMFTPEALHKEGDGLSFSTVVKGLSFKPSICRMHAGPANTKLYLQNTLRGEWFLLKKVTGLKKYLTTFVNQGNNPTVKLSNKKLHARGLEAKTTNLNSLLSFWLLSFVAFIIRLKLEKPDLNFFLAHYPFEISSVACRIAPQNMNVPQTQPGSAEVSAKFDRVEMSKIKAVVLLPKTFDTPFLTPNQTWNNRMLPLRSQVAYGESGKRVIVMHEDLQHILLHARVKLLKQNNQIELGTHSLVPTVGTLPTYTKVSKLPLSALGISLNQYYCYSFCRISPTLHYPTMLRMPNHQYSKKILQGEYLLFKKSQQESFFRKRPSVMGSRTKSGCRKFTLAPDLLAYKGTSFSTPYPRGV